MCRGMVDAQRLEHAPGAVADVEAQQNHRKDVPGGDIPDAESRATMLWYTSPSMNCAARMDDAGREMQQVDR